MRKPEGHPGEIQVALSNFSDKYIHRGVAKWEGIGFQTRHECVRFVPPLRKALQRFTVKRD